MNSHQRRKVTRAIEREVEAAADERRRFAVAAATEMCEQAIAERDKRIAELEELIRARSVTTTTLMRDRDDAQRDLADARRLAEQHEVKWNELAKANTVHLQRAWELERELASVRAELAVLSTEDRDAAKLRRRLREAKADLELAQRELGRWKGAVRQAVRDGRMKSGDALAQEAEKVGLAVAPAPTNRADSPPLVGVDFKPSGEPVIVPAEEPARCEWGVDVREVGAVPAEVFFGTKGEADGAQA